MKLIEQFKNKTNNITYSLYEMDCGIKLIYLLNPSTINFDFVSLHEAGNIYEEIDNIPHGCAHLMEHMLLNPNTKFKTQDDIYKFQEGDKNRPPLYINASTGYKYLGLVGSSNNKGTDRVLERIESCIEFPYSKFKKSLVNEKKIVTAERSRQPQIEKDHFIQKLCFLEGKEYPQFTYNRIGEVDKIKDIDIKDLRRYFTNRFAKNGVVFAIQSNKILTNTLITKLEKMGKRYSSDEATQFPKIELQNKLDYGYFYDEKATGTTIDLNYFNSTSNGIDYNDEATEDILNSILRKIGHLILREKSGLIYSLQTYMEDWLTAYHEVKCFRFVVENSRVEETLVKLDTFLFKDIEKFIKSEKGTRWINNILSNYIFPNTIGYNQNLPYDIAMEYFEYGKLHNHNKYVGEIQKITKKSLIAKLHELQSTPPHIWVESNMSGKEIEKLFKKSSFWKRFK